MNHGLFKEYNSFPGSQIPIAEAGEPDEHLTGVYTGNRTTTYDQIYFPFRQIFIYCLFDPTLQKNSL